MNLVKEVWTRQDGEAFQAYLKRYSKGEEKAAWEKRIVNTALPTLAVPSGEIDRMAREIAKGNATSFLDLRLRDNHSLVLVCGKVIGKVKDFDAMKRYLIEYARAADNWSAIDSVKFAFNERNKAAYFALARECLLDEQHTFVRRLGVVILLKMVAFPEYIDGILAAADTLTEEREYYVNMANAWLIAECFTKAREKTLLYLSRGIDGNGHNLNAFTIAKAVKNAAIRTAFPPRISSCCEPFCRAAKRKNKGREKRRNADAY